MIGYLAPDAVFFYQYIGKSFPCLGISSILVSNYIAHEVMRDSKVTVYLHSYWRYMGGWYLSRIKLYSHEIALSLRCPR